MFFATSILHVHLMQWEDESMIANSIGLCDLIWESIDPNRVSPAVCCPNVFFCIILGVVSFLLLKFNKIFSMP